MPEILIASDQMVRAFVRWERLYRQDPRAFVLEIEQLATTPEQTGEACSNYFTKLLLDVK
jgi:hypothetical protein